MRNKYSSFFKILFAALAVIWLAEPTRAEETIYQLNPEEVRCLQNNRSVYEKITTFPAIISLSDCPNIERDPILGMVQNEGPSVHLDPLMQFDNFLYLLEAAELKCLLDADVPNEVMVLFDPQDCKTETIGEQHERVD